MILMQQTAPSPATRAFDTDLILRTFSDIGTAISSRLPYLVIALIVFLGFLITGKILKRVLLTTGRRTRFDVSLSVLLGRLISFGIALLGLFVAAVIIFPTFQPGDLITGLGITSVAIGFAFKDVLQNFFAGILILWRQPFVLGDQIRVKDYEGTVEEINVRSTRLKTYDGTRAVIPNGDVYTSAILVFTAYDSRRVRFSVGIGYPDSIEKARTVIYEALKNADGVLDNPQPLVYVRELAPSSVDFDVYFWVKSQQADVLMTRDKVATGIKLALDKAKIDIPYPHRVVIMKNTTVEPENEISPQ